MQPDLDVSAAPEAALPDSRPRTTLDLAVAKLRTALQERSGYVVVTAETAAAAEALFTTVEPRLSTFRTVRTPGPALDPESVVRALWRDGEAPFPPRLAMRALLDEARGAGKPIVVAITDADALDPAKLERVRLTLEGTPDAGEIVRIALLGGPGLIDLLRQPDTRAIAMRIGASVAVPATPSELPAAVIVPVKQEPLRRLPTLVVGGALVAAALVAVVVSRRERPAPPPAPTPQPVVVARTDAAPLLPAPPVPPPAAADPPAVVPEPESPPAAVAPDPAPIATAPEPPPMPAAEPEPATPSPAPAPPGAALQVGAFVRPDGAETLRKKLAPQFPRVWVSPAKQDGTTFHRVRVGGFRSAHDLDLAAATLRTAGYRPLRVRE